MKALLTITALIEGFTGALLVAMPSAVVSLLLGVPLTDPSGMLLGRISGAALISLATACYLSRNNTLPSLIMIKAFVVYNAGATILLVSSALIENFSGIGLWPAVLLHIGLLIWCLLSLRK